MLCFENRDAPFVEVFRHSALAAGYKLELAAPGPDPAFAHFATLYRHFSVNPVAFELACFHRYFALRTRLAPSERAILADSDLIVQAGPAALPAEITDFGGLVGSIGVRQGVAEDDVSPHFSLWTGALARDFCDYLIHVYSERSALLAALHRRRTITQPRAAISDMTLIALWRREAAIPLLDTNRTFGCTTIDHNISTPESADVRYRARAGRKRIRFGPDGASFVTTAGRPIRPIVIHLQGRYKMAARAIAARQPGRLALISGYIALGRTARAILHP